MSNINTNNNIGFNGEEPISKYMSHFDSKEQPSEFRYNFNADIKFFDQLKFPDDNSSIKYKNIHHRENDNSKQSLYNNKYKINNISSNMMIVIFDDILIQYYYAMYNDDFIKEIDDDLISRCAIICLYDAMKYSITQIKTKCLDTLVNIKQYPADIFLQPEISLLVASKDGIDTIEYKINKPDIDFDLNYSPEFKIIHTKILEQLKLTKGLFIFDGDPGSGKTMYIRYLMDYICMELRKKVIYIPGEYISSLSGPDFIYFLADNKNSVLIIEDADTHIQSRSVNPKSSVSNILNLTDGFLNDCFEIQIILTYNIPTHQVDTALMRTGRLLSNHHFGKISGEQATKLSTHLNINKSYTEDVILAQVYSDGEDKSTVTNVSEIKPMGFQFPKK